MYGTHFEDSFSTHAVLSAASKRRPSTAVHGSPQKQQNQLVQQQLHSQTVRLREAFLKQDCRITGTIPKYMVAPCLKAGGLHLSREQCEEASVKFMTGEGRFDWLLFCNDTEKARSKGWSQASRIQSATAFKEIDKDGSGRLSRDELEDALKRWKVTCPPEKLDRLIRDCDADGDGNISYPEFVEGLSKELIAPSSIGSSVLTARPKRSLPASPRSSNHQFSPR